MDESRDESQKQTIARTSKNRRTSGVCIHCKYHLACIYIGYVATLTAVCAMA